MKPISTIKLSFKTSLPRNQLYTKTLKWMQSNSLENDDLWKHHYFTIYSTKEDKEIRFGIFSKPSSSSLRENNPAVIQFKQSPFSKVEIMLEIPRLIDPDSLNRGYPDMNHRYAHEIMEAIFPEISQEYLKIIYPLEYLNHILKTQNNMRIFVYFMITFHIILPFVWRSIVAKIISIVFISAWLIDKFIYKSKPDPFYSQMKKELYPDTQ